MGKKSSNRLLRYRVTQLFCPTNRLEPYHDFGVTSRHKEHLYHWTSYVSWRFIYLNVVCHFTLPSSDGDLGHEQTRQNNWVRKRQPDCENAEKKNPSYWYELISLMWKYMLRVETRESALTFLKHPVSESSCSNLTEWQQYIDHKFFFLSTTFFAYLSLRGRGLKRDSRGSLEEEKIGRPDSCHVSRRKSHWRVIHALAFPVFFYLPVVEKWGRISSLCDFSIHGWKCGSFLKFLFYILAGLSPLRYSVRGSVIC